MKPNRTSFEKRRERSRIRLKKCNRSDRLRLSVHRSNCHIYAQIIDDSKSVTVVSASTTESELAKTLKNSGNVEAAKAIGSRIAKKAIDMGLSEVIFDRSGYLFHGRVKALADAAREAGLKF